MTSSVQTLKLTSVLGPKVWVIGTSAASRPVSDQHAADSRDVIARIEGVPPSAKIGLEPAGEIHRAIGRRHADVAKVAGAIARRNIHAAAEGDGEVRKVAADALAFVEDFPGRHRRARMLVAEGDVAMDEIADRLNACPARRRVAEEVPGRLGQAVGLAVAAAQEKNQRLVRQILYRVLPAEGATASGRPLS